MVIITLVVAIHVKFSTAAAIAAITAIARRR